MLQLGRALNLVMLQLMRTITFMILDPFAPNHRVPELQKAPDVASAPGRKVAVYRRGIVDLRNSTLPSLVRNQPEGLASAPNRNDCAVHSKIVLASDKRDESKSGKGRATDDGSTSFALSRSLIKGPCRKIRHGPGISRYSGCVSVGAGLSGAWVDVSVPVPGPELA